MKKNINSGSNTAEKFVVAPEFSLLYSQAETLDRVTAEAFEFADDKARKQLFATREFLNFIFPDGAKSPETPEEQLKIAERLKIYLSYFDSNEDFIVHDHGYITLLSDSEDYFSAIIENKDHVTIDLPGIDADNRTVKFLRHITNEADHSKTKLYIKTDRYISCDNAKIITDLWNKGADITLCCNNTLTSAFKFTGFSTLGTVDFHGGIPVISGRSLIKQIKLDARNFPQSGKTHEMYCEIKSVIEEIVDAEISSRFTVASKSGIRYKSGGEYNALSPLGILYYNFISKRERKVRGILNGGAEYDCIYVTLENIDDGFDANSLTALASACNAYDEMYPVRIIPYYQNVRIAESDSDIKKIIADHSSDSKAVYGGSLLELVVSDQSLNGAIENVASLASAFFGMGGMILNLRHKEI